MRWSSQAQRREEEKKRELTSHLKKVMTPPHHINPHLTKTQIKIKKTPKPKEK